MSAEAETRHATDCYCPPRRAGRAVASEQPGDRQTELLGRNFAIPACRRLWVAVAGPVGATRSSTSRGRLPRPGRELDLRGWARSLGRRSRARGI